MASKLPVALIWLVLSAPSAATAATLQDAAKAGDVAQIKALLSQGADINGESGLAPPLFHAIQNRHEPAALALIKLGADVKAMSIWGTPLHAAAAAEMPMVAAWLIGYGADPNARWNEMTPLHIAARDGSLAVARILLDRGADPNALTRFEEPPLHLAVLKGHDDVAALLRAHGERPLPPEEIDSLLPAADPVRGKAIAFACEKCHSTEQASMTVCSGGPLWNIINRPKAQGETKFSPVLKALGGTWTYQELNEYLAHPSWAVPGTTMRTQGIHDRQDRADLIAYLRTLSDHPAPLP